MSGLGLTFLRRGNLAHPTAGSDYIKFKDAEVLRVLMANGVSSDGVGITREDAASVTSIGKWFNKNTLITSFDELEYFTGLTYLTTSTSASDGSGAFQGCSNLESVRVPPSLKIIGDFSFASTPKLLTIGDTSNVLSIKRDAFKFGGLVELSLPSCTSIAQLGEGAKLQVISMPSVTSIPNSAFFKITGLNKIILGESVTKINDYAFWSMSSNKTKLVLPTITPPSLTANNNMTFCNAIYVPDASVDAYKAANNWSSYASRIKPLSEYQG